MTALGVLLIVLGLLTSRLFGGFMFVNNADRIAGWSVLAGILLTTTGIVRWLWVVMP